jgi:hypothetical protein
MTALPQRDELAPKTSFFLSPSLNLRDFGQLVTVVRVLIYQAFVYLAFFASSTLARSRKRGWPSKPETLGIKMLTGWANTPILHVRFITWKAIQGKRKYLEGKTLDFCSYKGLETTGRFNNSKDIPIATVEDK